MHRFSFYHISFFWGIRLNDLFCSLIIIIICKLSRFYNRTKEMKNFVYFIAHIAILVVAVFSVLTVGRNLYLSPQSHNSEINLSGEGGSRGNESNTTTKGVKEEVGMELYPTGSTLPDCSHACGPCFPCKRVIVSFKCPMAESCPVVYRCMCRGKYYQVPSI